MFKDKLLKLSFAISIILILSFIHSCNYLQPENPQISKVENGLLPAVLIAGEPALNLEDRMAYYKVPGISVSVIKDYQT